MRHILFLFLILSILTAYGCQQQQPLIPGQDNLPDISGLTTTPSADWKVPIARRLLDEFYSFYNNMNNDDIIYGSKADYEIGEGKNAYSRTMAIDRATALLGVYRECVPPEDLDFIESRVNDINSKIGMTRVSFAYTKSGVHIIALSEGATNNSLLYGPLCNQIRELSDETAFFEEMFALNFMCDVYVEDLKEQRVVMPMNIEFYESNGGGDPFTREKVFEFSEDKLAVFRKYARPTPETESTWKNKEWHLLACAKYFDIININIDGEEIRLQSVIK